MSMSVKDYLASWAGEEEPLATDKPRDFAGGVVVEIRKDLFEDFWDVDWVDSRRTGS